MIMDQILGFETIVCHHGAIYCDAIWVGEPTFTKMVYKGTLFYSYLVRYNEFDTERELYREEVSDNIIMIREFADLSLNNPTMLSFVYEESNKATEVFKKGNSAANDLADDVKIKKLFANIGDKFDCTVLYS